MTNFQKEIKPLFESKGGTFFCKEAEFVSKISDLKAFVFDWDGVFNPGVKTGGEGSPFSEVDSMGLNMLRFGYYLKYNFIPHILVITGEDNKPALHLSKREHFSAVYLKAKMKKQALDHFVKTTKLKGRQIAFAFDDILDLGLASEVGMRFYIGRDANPLLNNYVTAHNLLEYQTANTGGENAVREICELCLGTLGNFDEVVIQRVMNSPSYKKYLETRNNFDTQYFKFIGDELKEIDLP